MTNGLGQSASAFSTSTVSLENQASFSTLFQFRISNPIGIRDRDGVGADGIVFVVQTVSNTAGGGGGGIGYSGLADSVGVEIDTWQNFEFGDTDGNHIGIDTEGNIVSLLVAPIVFPPRLNDGTDWFLWVDYDGATDQFEVRLAQSNSRPATPLLSLTLDLPAILGSTDVFAGFTSGTGAAGGVHDIVSWEFRSTFAPIGQPSVPAPASLVLLGLGLLGAAVVRRRR
ncbi:MAG: PEP-CTERM sorting domain-containing protein [Candidatus Rokubacteria bacterium]|nr:PEP-CTERM sorting domain-containing protein [Candidatus Rokubacteria bacterium]